MRPLAPLTRLFAILILAIWGLTLPVSLAAPAGKTVSFVFNDLDGQPVRLADLRGQWVLTAFWAPWCPLCKVQIPALTELDARPDLTVIAVAMDYKNLDEVRDKADLYSPGMRLVAGGSRRNPDSPHRQIGPVDFFPTSYLYDPTGEIVMYIPGQLRAGKVLAFMDKQGAPTATARLSPPAGLADFVRRTGGKAGAKRHADWLTLVRSLSGAPPAERLARVNAFFRQTIRLDNDLRVWGKQDYWASLGETLAKGAGDGEDHAIAKYFTLLAMHVPVERLRLVYVTQRAADPVHMVLAWFDDAGKDPLLLDSGRDDILPASRRSDLKPVFSFNSAGTWGDTGGRPTPWEDTLRRARHEGFE